MSKFLRLEQGWSTVVFLAGAVLAAGWTLSAAGWAEGLEVVPWVGIGGLCAGLLLGWSVFNSAAAHLIGAIYGTFWVTLLVGQQLPEGLTWSRRIGEMVARLAYWIHQAVTGGVGQDSLVFVIFLSILFWILGYSAAWNTYRRLHVWRAILPLGVVALVNTYYYTRSPVVARRLALYLFFALLYVARSHMFEEERQWKQEQVSYDPEIRYNFLQASFVTVAIVIALAWGLPTATISPRMQQAWEKVSEPWEVVKEEWQRLFSTLRGNPAPIYSDPFGSSMTLGGPRNPQPSAVMDVEAPRRGRYYWRGAIYTRYAGNRWHAPEGEKILLPADRQPPGMAQYELRRTVPHTVTNYIGGRRILLGASQPTQSSQEMEAYVLLGEEEPTTFIRMLSVDPLEGGERYSIRSQVTDADVDSLRQAGTGYPEWIAEYYLQLPDTLPERVGELAQQITQPADTPYDQAVMLEQYLRQNIEYNLTPPPLPEGRDYVDFMLFDSQQDYCNGYASAMVVMARSLGIPARMVSGYAQGEYDRELDVFRVQALDAHSWPEIYFPTYGWIEFEPTASQRPIFRPESQEETSEDEDLRRETMFGMPMAEEMYDPYAFDKQWYVPEKRLNRKTIPTLWPGVIGISVVLVVAAGWWALENWNLRGLTDVERAYARLTRFGSWLGRPLKDFDTPLEWSRDVSQLAPEANQHIQRIVSLYMRARFARGDWAALPEAQEAWRRARPILWRYLALRMVPFADKAQG